MFSLSEKSLLFDVGGGLVILPAAGNVHSLKSDMYKPWFTFKGNSRIDR